MAAPASSSFDLLDERIQRWIWAEGWTSMRDAQERAVPAIITADHDVIIAAATAAGKTEAAFLPILTHMLRTPEDMGLTVYISPLKALINDQFGRLERLCGSLDIPVWPWHGDIGASVKTRFFKKPAGILLITPESLEAILCNRGFAVPTLFAQLRYLVVDELHAFIGSERGKQLQSLMHRIDTAIERKAPRIGLSATLGDMRMAADFLRPGAGAAVQVIESASGGSELKVVIKGFLEMPPVQGETEEPVSTAEKTVAAHLFATLLGSNNLVFPNSRAKVEKFTHHLRKMCEQAQIPNEFWPHHGSLSRDIREETEAALKNKERNTTAICTSTLELGIDIGPVKSIAQIGTPPSVASLRQRLGRSGRREGEPAILRGYAIEAELGTQTDLSQELREGLFELIAMVSLLLEGWFEPPKADGLHLSTFVQQLLSLIAQRGGITAGTAFQQLCTTGPFCSLTKADYLDLLRALGAQELIQQDSSGLLLHGAKGEPIVNHYSFYAAFSAEEEFRVVAGSQTLGSLPLSSAVSVGDFILFAARTWQIEEIDEKAKTIFVKKHRSGKVPAFSSGGGLVHDKVRQRMRQWYEGTEVPRYLDPMAVRLFEEGRKAYARNALDRQLLLNNGSTATLLTWQGDRVNAALVAMLKTKGISAVANDMIIEISASAGEDRQVQRCLLELAQSPVIAPELLLAESFNLQQEKWDWALPESLLKKSFASLRLAIAEAHQWLVTNAEAFAT
ncbi:MAG: DEAD/DEAH box helicase [Agitococcus sp.]|nr:DEAD/DEAH box helicase [Agitococcus sp.]